MNAFDGFVGVSNDPALHDNKLPFWLKWYFGTKSLLL
jgi:hypothetical protein